MIRGLLKSDMVGTGLGSEGGFHSIALGWEAEATFSSVCRITFGGSLKIRVCV